MSNYTLRQALEMCRDYLSCIPESATGGDDDAVRLARLANEALAAQDETQPVVDEDGLTIAYLHGFQEGKESVLRKIDGIAQPPVEQGAPQPAVQQEPVAVVTRFHDLGGEIDWTGHVIAPVGAKLYLAAPAEKGAELSEAARDVLTERQRQVNVEGWTPGHDDEHDLGELSSAASSYALAAYVYLRSGGYVTNAPEAWPWDESWWKPGKDPRRMLIKAGALILAEVERLDRKARGGAA